MINLENKRYNTETFNVEQDFVYKQVVNNSIFNEVPKEDLIEILVDIYRIELIQFLDEKKYIS